MDNHPDITIVGLGPGDVGLVTRQVWDLLRSTGEIFLRTQDHPVVEEFPESLKVISFDEFYEENYDYPEIYRRITDRVLEHGRRKKGVVYGVPGDPFVAETTTALIREKAAEEGLSLRILPGLSFLEPVFHAVGQDPLPRLAVVDAVELGRDYHPSFPPDYPAVVVQVFSAHVAAELKLTLMAHYPDDHTVTLVHRAGLVDQVVEELALYEIDRSEHTAALTCLYVPALEPGTSMESFQELIAHLRSPEGCPWDREQTHDSLRPYLLEETYEALAALESGSSDEIEEELGDLLIQIVLHAQIAAEEGEFNLAGVIKKVSNKLIHRHPHVFGELTLEDAEAVKFNWERLKSEERAVKKSTEQASALSGVPVAMPALSVADAYQKRAARVGFDWPEVGDVIAKIHEEFNEVLEAEDSEELGSEIGDLLFAVVNLARWHNLDAEGLLRGTNSRFRYRFNAIEQEAARTGRQVPDLSLEQMEMIWQSAKRSPEN